MPNGDRSFDFQDMEQFFAPIADAVHEFARRRNLLVDKYYHNGRDWSLRFNHPKGGQVSIELIRDNQNHLFVCSVWHFDDFDKFTRYLHWGEKHECPRVPEAIAQMLEDQFQRTIAIKFGNWNEVAGGYDSVWSRYSLEEFKSMAPKLPDPTIDNWAC